MAVNRFQNVNSETEQKSVGERDQLTNGTEPENGERNQHRKLVHHL